MPGRIITRGLGPSTGISGRSAMVTYGYGPPPFVVTTIRRVINGGSSAKRRQRELEPVVIWAKLLEINGKIPTVKISDYAKSYLDESNNNPIKDIKHVSSGAAKVWDNIKFSIKRIK